MAIVSFSLLVYEGQKDLSKVVAMNRQNSLWLTLLLCKLLGVDKNGPAHSKYTNINILNTLPH
jgi:hypothetical protein